MAPKSVISTFVPSGSSHANYEAEYVHAVYDNIAQHFSSTRYKPWPVVAAFLASIPPGSIGLDAGTGNGKYLIAPPDREGKFWTIALDRSRNLLDIAQKAGGRERECVLSDVLGTCWRKGCFDFAISIATIHHLSTPERRKDAVKSLLLCLSPSCGRGLIYVWATEQDELSKRSIPTANEVSSDSRGQDVFVPWKLAQDNTLTNPDRAGEAQESLGAEGKEKIFNRYYHMFEKGELRELVVLAAQELEFSIVDPQFENSAVTSKTMLKIVKDDWERSNYYLEFRLCQQR